MYKTNNLMAHVREFRIIQDENKLNEIKLHSRRYYGYMSFRCEQNVTLKWFDRDVYYGSTQVVGSNFYVPYAFI